jgi:hypothetical protein
MLAGISPGKLIGIEFKRGKWKASIASGMGPVKTFLVARSASIQSITKAAAVKRQRKTHKDTDNFLVTNGATRS